MRSETRWKLLFVLMTGGVILLDQWTKQRITTLLGYGERIPVIEGFFNITYHRNFGAAWGILQGALPFFIVTSVIVTAGLLFVLYRSRNRLLDLAISLLLAGAIGNFIDRIKGNGVVDFLEFFIFSYDFPVFNVADMGITCGSIILAVYLLFIHKDGDLFQKKAEA